MVSCNFFWNCCINYCNVHLDAVVHTAVEDRSTACPICKYVVQQWVAVEKHTYIGMVGVGVELFGPAGVHLARCQGSLKNGQCDDCCYHISGADWNLLFVYDPVSKSSYCFIGVSQIWFLPTCTRAIKLYPPNKHVHLEASVQCHDHKMVTW